MFLKKKILLAFFSLFLCFPFFGSFYPSELTEKSQVSIITLKYNDNSKKIFNKHLLRFYDRNLFFDEIFDFSSFDNFEDKLFTLKFLFKNKKARYKSQSFMEFYTEAASNENLSITEKIIDLSLHQKNSLYYKILFHKISCPNYSYNFDFYKRNSAIIISNLLKEINLKTNDSLFNSTFCNFPTDNVFFSIFSSRLKTNNPFNLTNESSEDSKILILKENPHEPVIISSYSAFTFQILCFLTFAFSLFQLFYKINSIHYRSLVNILSQSIDFLIFFISGITGLIIIYFNLFTNQFLLTLNINFLFLNPLNLIICFLIFSEKKYEKLKFTILLIINIMILSYLVIQIANHIYQPIALSCSLILFFRILYHSYGSVLKYICQKLKKEKNSISPEKQTPAITNQA